jgi:hypothetical protein
MLARAGDMLFLLPAPIRELLDTQISIPIDLNRDADWLPLLTHRLLASERRTAEPEKQADEQVETRIAEGQELIDMVASTYRNLGGTKDESCKAATDAYRPGDNFDTLFRRGITSIAKAR